MKILLINGCEKDNVLGNEVLQNLTSQLTTGGHTLSTIALNTLALKPCLSCDSCQLKKPGTCVINDGLNDILKQYIHSDLVFLITEITFGCCNALTKPLLDRSQPLYMPYQKLSSNVMAPRYDKYPDIHFIGLTKTVSDASVNNFKETLLNSTLALQSKKRSATVVRELSDLNNISL